MTGTDHMLHAALLARIASQKEADHELRGMCNGRMVRITADYNGQPFGCSRPNLKGKEFEVRNAFFDDHSITLWLEGGTRGTLAIDLTDVRFLLGPA
jgi:hypothetical protein